MQNPYAPPFNYWDRFYGTINGQLCSWSFSPDGAQSPPTCELPYQPRGTEIITPNAPYVAPTTPVIVVDPNPPVTPTTITPEPATFAMLAVGIVAVFVARKLK